MLVELAIGDAYGISFEFVPEAVVKSQNIYPPMNYVFRPDYLLPGQYTDDTQMSLALAEHIAEGRPWDKMTILKTFFDAFKRDPRRGYSNSFYHLLKSSFKVETLARKLEGTSNGCGAAMRAVPCALAPDIDTAIYWAGEQAKVTHNNEQGINSAKAIAAMAFYAHKDIGDAASVYAWIRRYVPGISLNPIDGFIRNNGEDVVRAAAQVYSSYNTMTQILWKSVDFTGDVDSVAAIAMGCAALSKRHTNDLPKSFYDNLENGTYGRDYLKALDTKLGV